MAPSGKAPSGKAPAGKVVRCAFCDTANRVPDTAKGRPRCGSCQRDLPWLVEADDDSFGDATHTGLLVLVDLWAPWCGPCRTVAPVLERLSVTYAGSLKVVKVNVDQSPRTAAAFRASSIPMLVLLRNGKAVDTLVGAHPEHVLARRIDAQLT